MLDTYLIAILLGIIEGVTEFLPISSTGHLILCIEVLGFNAPKGHIFEIVVQLGAILAICLVFHARITHILCHFHRDKATRGFSYKILLAFLPAAIIGALAHSIIKSVLFAPVPVAVMLIVGGIIILLIERIKPVAHIHQVEQVTYRHALIIGGAQAVAMIPGTSRSGATMMASLLLGIDRKTAAEFSFLLAIPTMLAATCYDIFKNYQHLSIDDVQLIAVGFFSAFFSALLSVRWLLNFLTTHGFTPFAYYRIVLGGLILVLL